MSDLPRRVVILMHAKDRVLPRRRYQIFGLAKLWRAWGVEVIEQYGTEAAPDADVIVNHVDLTRVPEPYAALLTRYPVAINRDCLDLSKRVVSEHLLSPGDDWDGEVIVKTDLNSGGESERARFMNPLERALDGVRERLLPRPWRDGAKPPGGAYVIFHRLADVPADVWHNPKLVVERFLPEHHGEGFITRSFTFFGDGYVNHVNLSASRIVKTSNTIRADVVEPHPDVWAAARRLKLDRGKIDYVIRQGRAVVLDANRTSLLGVAIGPERRRLTCERLAPGLRAFWPPRGNVVSAP